MQTTSNPGTPKNAVIILAAAFGLLLALAALLLTSFSRYSGESYVCIDDDDTADSVYVKLQADCQPRQMAGLRIMAALTGYASHVQTGRYATGEGISSLRLMRNLRGRHQAPVHLVIPITNTPEIMAGKLATIIEPDSATLVHTFRDSRILADMGLDDATLPCLFLPNTFEIYWDIEPRTLMYKLKKAYDAFWTPIRRQQARAAGLTPNEVITLASIVEKESQNNNERPMIAGMYLNRLRQGMKLQADPTVKFALKDFGLRRIMHGHLTVNSPYNTYRYEGLPPGPICNPSVAAIEAVLNYTKHSYIYMCAKEDFSGTHNFATTYAEHTANARRYAEALNQRGIE